MRRQAERVEAPEKNGPKKQEKASKSKDTMTAFHEAQLHIKERKVAWQKSCKESPQKGTCIKRRNESVKLKWTKGRGLHWPTASER